jgi:hypothetical protein
MSSSRQLSPIERWVQDAAAKVNADRVGECLTDNLRQPSRARYSTGKCRCSVCYAAYKASKATREEVAKYLDYVCRPAFELGERRFPGRFSLESIMQEEIEADPWGHICRRAMAEARELSAPTP